MKRSASLFFIFIANIVILVHSAIPHHHEDNLIDSCTIHLHNNLSANNKCPHNDTLKIQQNSTGNSQGLSFEECQMEDLYIRISNEENNLLTKELNLDITIQFIPICILKLILPIPPEYIEDIFAEYIPPIYKSLISHYIGLRAPPIY